LGCSPVPARAAGHQYSQWQVRCDVEVEKEMEAMGYAQNAMDLGKISAFLLLLLR
jgi:hypothetical protein